jgi:hypothetical protein
MARYAYDVNTTQRYIDVHKQFQGGLKTVDTDDALGAVFLRQAENVSLSEFGFIEKRYGTYENFKKQVTGNLQGYWEFEGEIIYAANGNIHIADTSKPFLVSEKIIDYYLDTNLRYPNLDDVFGGGDYSLRDNGSRIRVQKINTFQNTKDMNAVQANGVLYIFTGTYPVYIAKEDDGSLKPYLFNITIPSYDEIVVTGHNFLEYDFENILGYDDNIPRGTTNYIGTGAKPVIYSVKADTGFPYVFKGEERGKINFAVNAGLPNIDFWSPTSPNRFTEIDIESVKYRNSGAGASVSDYIELNRDEVDFVVKNNYNADVSDIIFDDSEHFYQSNFKDNSYIVKQKSGGYDYYFYEALGEFFVPKNAFQKNKEFKLQFLTNQTGAQTIFDFETLERIPGYVESVNNRGRFIITITPMDASGKEYTDNASKIYWQDGVSFIGDSYKVSIPSSLYQGANIVQYKFSFYSNGSEIIKDQQTGPYLLTETPGLYSYKFLAVGEKRASAQVMSASVPRALDFSVNKLISGTYDFEVTFAFKTYVYSSSTLTLNNTQYFSGETNNITITEEPLQDYPGLVDELKLKAVWSCNKVIEHFGKLMIWGSTEMPTAVFYSFPDRPTYFPTKFYLDFQNDEGSPVQSVAPYMNILVAQTEDRTWGIRGNSGLLDSPAPYIPFMINPTVGTIAYKSVRPVRNHLFFLSKQGVIALKSLYAADEQYNIDFMDRNVRNIVAQDTKAVGIQYDNQYWLNFPESGITLRWYIDKKAWVQDKYTAWEDFNGVLKWQVIDGKLEFITYPSRFEDEGNTFMYKVGVDYSLPTDLGEAVVAKFETSFLNQNYPFHPKNYKEAKLDFTLQNEYNLGRNALYEMESNEDIIGTVHTIQATIIKNHRYRLQYNFVEEETTIIDGGVYQTPANQFTETLDGGANYITASELLDLLYYYAVGSVLINGVYAELFPINYNTVEFLVPNNGGGNELTVIGSFTGYEDGASLFDASYSDTLIFKTWVISEDQALNIDNYEGYNEALADVDIDLAMKDRMGDWVFGTSDFGKKVTAVKTIKLSGKGYNAKLYMEDYTRSKWTLESLGLTYKMKRARSR